MESGDADELDSADHTNISPTLEISWRTYLENPARTTKTMTNAIHDQVTGGRNV